MNNSTISTALQKYTYAFAIWTDRADFVIDKNADLCEGRLLEIRCFDKTGEYRAVRTTPDMPFSEREITSDESWADGYYDEAQYLDFDTARTEKKADDWTYATGGGRYHLPEDAKDQKLILVRNYYRFDEEGIARKYDWRLVKFTDQETWKGGKVNGEFGTKK